MNKRGIWLAVLATAVAGTGWAEVARPLMTKESRFPALRRPEVGTLVEFVETTDNNEANTRNDGNLFAVTPTVRYRPLQDWTFRADLPVGYYSPDFAGSEFGFGDLLLGAELLAYEDFFRFPYVIPHAALKLDTGDEDTTLGDGESSLVFGLTIGSQIYDVPIHVNFDISYELFEDTDNVLSGAASMIWAVSDRFDVLVEGGLSDKEPVAPGAQEHPYMVQAGMLFKTAESWTLGLYGGGYKNSTRDVAATIRVVKEF